MTDRLQNLPEEWADLSVVDRFKSSLGERQGSYSNRPRPNVLGSYRRILVVSDTLILAAALILALLASSRASAWGIDPLFAVYGTPVIILVVWLGLLAFCGSYDQRIVGLGTEEVRRTISAALCTFAIVAGIGYLFRADISRAYAFVSLPIGLILIIISRFFWRRWLYIQRQQHRFQYSTLVVGSGSAAEELVQRLNRDGYAGYRVVGRYAAPLVGKDRHDEWLAGLTETIDRLKVEAIAITPSETITGSIVREIAWRIESRFIDFLIAPTMVDISGPRLSVRPAAGLPLLHLDEAALSRPKRFAKRALDLLLSSTMILFLSPLMLGTALAVKCSSRGPVLFRQARIGRAGKAFTILKFRTMVQNAEDMRGDLRGQHGVTSPMFKLRDDPRITRIGRYLRRWSIDELPQLFNVIGGSMSLVGPRPHPLDDVHRYELEAYRRLALKPGLTGLWQVEGRSNLTWREALQFDLYYIETWSLSGDLVLLARTIRAVLQGRGAV